MRLMRFGVSVCFLIASTLGARAWCDEPVVKRLWAESPPGPLSIVNGDERDFTKPEDNLVGGRPIIKLGNVSIPEMHVFLPAEKGNGGAVLVCPGGGFSILAWDLEGTEVAHWLNSLGYAAVVLKYRVPTRAHSDNGAWEGPVMDAQRALSLIRANASQWQIDPRRIGILGFSAGGQTAARVLVAKGKRTYEASDDYDQQSCAADFALLIYPAWIADADGQLSEGFQVDAETAPVFFVHAFNDRISCMSSVALFAALKQANVPSELHVYADGGHGYGLRETDLPVTRWTDPAAAWLQHQITKKP